LSIVQGNYFSIAFFHCAELGKAHYPNQYKENGILTVEGRSMTVLLAGNIRAGHEVL
jgi:hypothetical protein